MSAPARGLTPTASAVESGSPLLATPGSRPPDCNVARPACMQEVSCEAEADPAVVSTAVEARTAAAAMGISFFMSDSCVVPECQWFVQRCAGMKSTGGRLRCQGFVEPLPASFRASVAPDSSCGEALGLGCGLRGHQN